MIGRGPEDVQATEVPMGEEGWQGEEQRAFARAALRLGVEFMSDAGDEVHEGDVTDVSRGGLGLVVARPIEAGTRLVVRVGKRGLDRATLRAVVVAVRDATSIGPGQFQLGCRFLMTLAESEGGEGDWEHLKGFLRESR